MRRGPPADFFVELSGEVEYDGPVTTETADAGAFALVGRGEAGPVVARFGGVVPAILSGTALWATLSRHTFHGNPFSSTTTSASVVRTSKHGPVIAETRVTFMPSGSSGVPFLGVNLTTSRLCSRHEVTNIATGASCMTTDIYTVTIHGDSDLTLTPTSEGHVTVAGIEYEVWLVNAIVESIDLSTPPVPCVADWEPPPGLSISAPAVHYEDVLKAARDAGAG